MDESWRLMRFELDGKWSAEEFGQLFVSLSNLYDLRMFLALLREDIGEWERYYQGFLDFPPSVRRRIRRYPYRTLFPFWQQLPNLDDSYLSRLSELIAPEERLRVRQIDYASPGITDLTGMGEVVGHLKDLVLRLIERRDEKRSRDLSEERAALENERLRIANARKFVALGRELGYSKTELRRLIRHVDEKQDPIIRLISQRKLLNVSIKDEQ